MDFPNFYTGPLTKFPTSSVTTRNVLVYGPTPENPWRIETNAADVNYPDGFKVECSNTEYSGPIEIQITYDPSAKTLVAGKTECIIFQGKTRTVGVHFSDKKCKVVVPVEIDTNDDKDLPEYMTCTICYHPFSDTDNKLKPKTLPCGHTFCALCLSNTKLRNCSKCRAKIVCPRDQLPINWSVVQSISDKKDEKSKIRMDANNVQSVEEIFVPCYEDPQHESKVYCNECEQAYCPSCFKKAHSIKFMIKHESIPVAEMPIIVPDCPKCPPDEKVFPAFSYCTLPECADDKIACRKCRDIHHHKHKAKNIQPFLEDNYASLERLLEKSDEAVEGRAKCSETAKNVLNTLEKERGFYVNQILIHFNKMKSNAINKFHEFVNKEARIMTKVKSHMDESVEKFKGVRNNVEGALKRKTNLHDVDDLLQEMEGVISDSKYDGVKFFHLKDHKFTLDMSVLPTPPVKRPRIVDEEDVAPQGPAPAPAKMAAAVAPHGTAPAPAQMAAAVAPQGPAPAPAQMAAAVAPQGPAPAPAQMAAAVAPQGPAPAPAPAQLAEDEDDDVIFIG